MSLVTRHSTVPARRSRESTQAGEPDHPEEVQREDGDEVRDVGSHEAAPVIGHRKPDAVVDDEDSPDRQVGYSALPSSGTVRSQRQLLHQRAGQKRGPIE